jgi:hypothetical protein
MAVKKTKTTLPQGFLREFSTHWPLAKGSLRFVRRPCIRPNYPACQRGEKHAAWIFTFGQGGKQRCRYVPKDLVPLLRQAIANGRWLEARITETGADLIEQYRQERARRAKG